MPGANAMGKFAIKPIIKQAIDEDAAVAVIKSNRTVSRHSSNSEVSPLLSSYLHGPPVNDNIDALTAIIYAMVTNVTNPARISVIHVDFRSCNLK